MKIKIILRTSIIYKNGKSPLMLRFILERTSKLRSLDLSVEPRYRVPDRPEHTILHELEGCLLSDCPKQPTIQYMLYSLRYHKKSVQKSNTKTK